MDKGLKILAWIIGILAAIFLGVFIFLTKVYNAIPKELEFPPSGLSQSIFDSQNTKYTPNASFTDKHYFYHSPYSVDIANTDAAKVGDYGVVYEISDSMYFYITEFEKGSNVETMIRNELSQAVMVDANASMTAVDNYVYDEGYLNGFKADYYIDGMTVTNGTRTASVYITGYTLTITDTDKDHGYRMFIGVMAASSDTETYKNGKAILDSVVATYQYNSDIQNSLLTEEENARRAEEAARQEAMENGGTYIAPQQASEQPAESLIVSTNGSNTDMAASAEGSVPQQGTPGAYSQQTQQQGDFSSLPESGQIAPNDMIREDAYINNNATEGQGAASGAQIPQQKTKAMNLDKDYEGVTLYYYYTNTDNQVDVSLVSPDGIQTYHPTSAVGGTIVFKLDKMVAGKWHVQISGDPGSDDMKLYSESLETGDNAGGE